MRLIRFHPGLAGLLLFAMGVMPLPAKATTNPPEPAELPPGDYTEAEYVDSAGCVFMRAERGGTVVWAARLDADRTPVCDRNPSLTAPASAPDTVTASLPPQARQQAPTQHQRRAALPANPSPGFTRGNRAVPPGFAPAWHDDRLNPRRARGTAAGEAQMNRLWSATVPRVLLPGYHLAGPESSTAPTTRRYVDAGAYRNPQNARRVVRHLQGGGYPVEVRLRNRRQAVFAGPFVSAEDQQNALLFLHRSGLTKAAAVQLRAADAR